MKKIVIAFVPVLHQGYKRFFERYKDAKELYIIGPEVAHEEFPHLKKEIRALDTDFVVRAVESWQMFERILIVDRNLLEYLSSNDSSKYLIIMPKEDIMMELAEKYFSRHDVMFDSIFLRWDKHNSLAKKPVNPASKISSEAFDKEVMGLAFKEAQKSSDWWRQIGAVIVKNGEIVLVGYNKHVPSEHTPYMYGDPRNNFHKGIYIELSTALHAEAGVIAEAAKKGIALEGADIYVSTFPCPPCAKLVAYSGFRRLFYRHGYGVLDGENVLRCKNVEIIYVEM